MRLSTRTRYGTRAMVELAMAHPDTLVSVRELAANQNLSVKYLEHIMARLKAAALVKPVRGMRGGYALAKPPAEITLHQIFRALEGSAAVVECVDQPEACPVADKCPAKEIWDQLTSALRVTLDRTTLEALVERGKWTGSRRARDTFSGARCGG
jgi:Rrf2 family protein